MIKKFLPMAQLEDGKNAIVIMGDNRLVIKTDPKNFHFDLPKDDSINLKHETYIIK